MDHNLKNRDYVVCGVNKNIHFRMQNCVNCVMIHLIQ